MKRRFITAAARSKRFQCLFEGLCASEGMDAVARYLGRGRTLSGRQTEALKDCWRNLLRKQIDGGTFGEAIEDVYSELTLRGIYQVELPQDLEVLIVARHEAYHKEIDTNSEQRMAFFERIFAFAETLRKTTN